MEKSYAGREPCLSRQRPKPKVRKNPDVIWLSLDKLYLSAHPLVAMTLCVLAIFACCLALDLVRQGLFAVTVDHNRGRWFELVWNKATAQTKPMQVHAEN